MGKIVFIDAEIDPSSGNITDLGGVKSDGSFFREGSTKKFIQFIEGEHFICGHNILNHDLKFLNGPFLDNDFQIEHAIDTLFLSPLLFPDKPYHSLLKDDKLLSEDLNNPLNDAKKAKDLFHDEVAAFNRLDEGLKAIFYLLLHKKKEFGSFFNFLGFKHSNRNIEELVVERFTDKICSHAEIDNISRSQPIELAYCLSLISATDAHSLTPPWVLKSFPGVEQVMSQLRSKPCLTGCSYCDKALDVHHNLRRFFGYDAFRKFGGEPLQEQVVRATVDGKSILTVFPTGGGKSLTFQLPALMQAESERGLTVVISPLQSLMKDQVDNLEKVGITEAVTINGLLDPIERAKSFERVEDGTASILYISPESLRSRTIHRLILTRKIARFVIDEAHCFSSWGQDFRVDYLYIADFIKSIQTNKSLEESIPISCFTATAKQRVIEDIRNYFKEKLSLDLFLFQADITRNNLEYKVFEKENDDQKYLTTRNLVEQNNCPTIIYVSRTRKADVLADKLRNDGFSARSYHGRMDTQEKTANQNAFVEGEVSIMVATSAFGMGVDKKDVGMVIHYEISDSLENYVQEAGRAGRDANMSANCYVLFNEEDLSKHFILLNQSKLSIKEIQQIWRAIKGITKFRASVSNSALEIARKAGWDDEVYDIETRVTTAIAALEDAGYLRRGQNMPRIFANSIRCKNAQEAIDKIRSSHRFSEKQKESGIRIIKKLFASKRKKLAENETGESRIDYISDQLGIVKEEVISVINLLREENILADTKDLTAFIKRGESSNRSLSILNSFGEIERFLLSSIIEKSEKTLHIKEVNERAEEHGLEASPVRIKSILNLWALKNWIKKKRLSHTNNHIAVCAMEPIYLLQEKMQKRLELSRFIVTQLYEKSRLVSSIEDQGEKEVLVDFSVLELRESFENSIASFGKKASIAEVEDALFYLSKIEAIKIEGGFLVIYNKLTIERLGGDNYKRYTKDDYKKLDNFYENKVQQIHIVGEYAKKMISNYKGALQFVEDYFQLNYSSFLNKHFPGSKADDLKRKITPSKFRQLFGELSSQQLKIINDSKSKYIAVTAGPGSGKTRVLVHKLASLLLMEDVKHEQLLMLTFSRAAATEFKKRLFQLIGNAVHYISIQTFHGFCFDLLGKVGNLEKSGTILSKTIEEIEGGEVEVSKITKTVLVVDEAQDMDGDEFEFIKVLMRKNEEMRVIMVGDDDQNIYEFRKASSRYMAEFIREYRATKYELIENYRSKSNLVEYTNQFVSTIKNRLKDTPIIPKRSEEGEIRLVHYQSSNLIVPFARDLLNAELKGSTCVLTRTNEEALKVMGLLLKYKLPVRLIQTNDSFGIYNLVEVRYFLSQLGQDSNDVTISDEQWELAKQHLQRSHQNSTNLKPCLNLIRDFEITNSKKKYMSDLESFISESRLEDFFHESGETIYVSTIHKVKGKEFDNVFILLNHFKAYSDEAKRQLYVAMTRAKQNLTLHLNSDFLDSLRANGLIHSEDDRDYGPIDELVMHLSHKDLWLDFFISRQSAISSLRGGETLVINGYECLNAKRQPILKFSKRFIQQIEQMDKDYQLTQAKVNFILFWQKEEREIKIVLPELKFEKV